MLIGPHHCRVVTELHTISSLLMARFALSTFVPSSCSRTTRIRFQTPKYQFRATIEQYLLTFRVWGNLFLLQLSIQFISLDTDASWRKVFSPRIRTLSP